MKKHITNPKLDATIGFHKNKRLTTREQDEIKAYKRQLFEHRSTLNKIEDILTGFRFTLKRYLEDETVQEVILLGQFLNTVLKQINVKKGHFAEYIDISPRNINKYFNGERKFNIDHALKLEKVFNIQAEQFLEIQLKNDLIKAKKAQKGKYNKYNLKDLLQQ